MTRDGRATDTRLPPGQRAIAFFPRFGVPAFANRAPADAPVELLVSGPQVTEPQTVRQSDFETLPRRAITADFHCVTTWSQRGLLWEGWAFREVYEAFIAPRLRAGSAPRFLEVFARDGYRTSVLLEDALAPNVLLADRLGGAPIPIAHGSPLRLVAPDLYAYKSVKHVARIEPRRDFRPGLADRQTNAHPRGRVAFEERGRGLPGWVYRYLYRALFPPTLWYYRHQEKQPRQ